MYDVRLPNLRALRGDAKRMQSRILKTMRGRSSRATGGGGTPPMYEVRRTMYDLQIMRSRAAGIWRLTPPGGRRSLPMDDVRRRRRGRRLWTIFDVRCTIAIIARFARGIMDQRGRAKYSYGLLAGR